MALLTEADFSQFKLRVNIKTSIENVYKAWATSSGSNSWFLGNMIFTDENGVARPVDSLAQVKDKYTCFVNCQSDQVMAKGEVLKANGKNLFSFSFSKGCPVTISIYTEHNETIVELIESNLPTDEDTIKKHYVGDSKGWIFFLTNMKSVLEGGLDLRNKNADIKNVITH
jgi:hypothetical protein